jgi:hypothetical protein
LGTASSARLEQLRRGLADPPDGRGGVGHGVHLDLGDHQGVVHGRLEAARGADPLGRVRGGGDDAGLLDGHRDEVVPPVDPVVERDAEGQPQRADGVLHHVVGDVGVDAPLLDRVADLALVEGGDAREEVPALLDAHLAEVREDGGVAHAPRSSAERGGGVGRDRGDAGAKRG